MHYEHYNLSEIDYLRISYDFSDWPIWLIKLLPGNGIIDFFKPVTTFEQILPFSVSNAFLSWNVYLLPYMTCVHNQHKTLTKWSVFGAMWPMLCWCALNTTKTKSKYTKWRYSIHKTAGMNWIYLSANLWKSF